MATDSRTGNNAPVNSCGCPLPPRRRCELCGPPQGYFLACSLGCLDKHRAAVHAGQPNETSRMRAHQRATTMNAQTFATDGQIVWDLYKDHRERMARLVLAASRGEGLCALGAGNAMDLDIPAFVHGFGEVHLVDIDGAALQRALQRQPPAIRARVVAHGEVDFTGCLDRIDAWGENLPSDTELAELVRAASSRIAARVGRTFDVVLSGCSLSQLTIPAETMLVMNMADWQRVFAAVARAHLATMAALLRPEGTGILVFDTASSQSLPALADYASPLAWSMLPEAIEPQVRAMSLPPNRDPQRILKLFSQAPLTSMTEQARLTDPWVWNIQTGAQLVYALLFRRPSDP